MGKGSNRRPGTGYADNWEATFGKKPEPQIAEIKPAVMNSRQWVANQVVMAHALSSKPDARQHVRDVAEQIKLEKQDPNA